MKSKILGCMVLVFLMLGALSSAVSGSSESIRNSIKEKEEQVLQGVLEKGENTTVIRTPEEVYSWQPAFIFAKVSDRYYYHNVTLDVEIEITRRTSLPSIPPTPLTINYSTQMVPVSQNYYISGIPGLPNETFYLGNQPPTTEVTSPTSGQTVSAVITIRGTAYDPENNLQKVEVSIDNSTFQTNTLSVSGTTTWSASWDTTQYSDGAHLIWARSYDGEFYSIPVSVSVVVDNVGAPTPVALAYKEITSSSVLLNWSQNLDPDFDKYEVHKSTNAGFSPSSATLVTTIISRATTQYNVTGLNPQTTYYFKVRVYNIEGLYSNSNEISATTLSEENQPPTADFTYSPTSPTTADTIQFTDTSTDPDGYITAWAWDFGDDTGSTEQNPTHLYTTHGSYTVTLAVTDNQSAVASTSKTIAVSNKPPTVSIITPTEGDTVSGVINITGKASDETAVNEVEVKIDAGEWILANLVELQDGTVGWWLLQDTLSLTDGSHTIYARAYDGYDYSSIASVNVTVDNQPGRKSKGDYITVYSIVTYYVKVDGVQVHQDSYIVKAGRGPQLKPIIYALDYSVLTDPSLLYETGGLGPRGWALNENTIFKCLILALDEKGLTKDNLTFFYNVNDSEWTTLPVYDSPLMGILNSIITDANEWITLMNEWLDLAGFKTLPPMYLPLVIGYTEITGQAAGSYVRFYANATDFDNNTSSSPMGFYYVDKESSATKILVVDPNFYLWFTQENILHFTNMIKKNINYRLPSDLVNEYSYAKKIADLVQKYGIVPFRHWEYLGEYYDIYVIKPDKNIPDFLDSFKPDVVFLSNIWLGFRRLSSSATGPWNWDLKDLEVQDDIISYVKTNHSALIATHGTLSDWVVWFDNTPDYQYKVGTKGHIGNTTSEFNPISEKTIAAMLGMPELTLWEWGRDETANYLCELGKEMMKSPDPYTKAAGAAIYTSGLVIGSTPLQVPYIPFEGDMKKTPEAKFVGWDIPENFTIKIPLVREYTNGRLNATTEVGWQLALPRSIAYAAWWKAQELRPYAEMLYSRLAHLVQNTSENIISRVNITERLNDSLNWALRSFYKYLVSANITGTSFNFTLNLSQINETLNRTIEIALDVARYGYNLILQFMPVRLVALSPNCVAGIITYDKYFDPQGYRSVYFSFEPEAAKGSIAKTLLREAVEWSKAWKYNNITELLGDLIRVAKDVARKFNENFTTTLGTYLKSESLILNEEGGAITDLHLQSGSIATIIVAHPTTDSVTPEIVSGNAEIATIQNLGAHLTKIKIKAHTTGVITIGFRASSDASLNPAHLSIKENREHQLTSYEPLTNPTINEGETQTFTVTASDPDNDNLSIEWKVNNVVVAIGSAYTFQTDYTSAAIYIINVTVTDGEFYIYHEWTLTVNDATIAEITPVGGNITFGNVAVEVPAGASTTATTITTNEVSVTPPKGCKVVGKAYRIESTTMFTTPVKLTLSYNDADLLEGINESELAIWKKAGDKWIKLGGEVDTVKNTITVEVTSFSEYAIFYGEPIEEVLLPVSYILIIGMVVLIAVIGCVVALALKRRKR